jgi:hypothetical protein
MTRYAGIDLAKRTMEVRVADGDKIERHRLARMPEKEAGCEAIALNPGDLRIIWKRRAYGTAKKTDREDALKMRSICGTRRRRGGAAYRFRAGNRKALSGLSPEGPTLTRIDRRGSAPPLAWTFVKPGSGARRATGVQQHAQCFACFFGRPRWLGPL